MASLRNFASIDLADIDLRSLPLTIRPHAVSIRFEIPAENAKSFPLPMGSGLQPEHPLRTAPVLDRAHDAVDHFIERTRRSGGYDQAPPVLRRLSGQHNGFTRFRVRTCSHRYPALEKYDSIELRRPAAFFRCVRIQYHKNLAVSGVLSSISIFSSLWTDHAINFNTTTG
jgi:hypothetical protein